MKDSNELTDDELRRLFLANGSDFFGWNSGKNTPNVLKQLSESIGLLNQNLKNASDSSSRLAGALNRLTLAAVIVYGLTLLATVAGLAISIMK